MVTFSDHTESHLQQETYHHLRSGTTTGKHQAGNYKPDFLNESYSLLEIMRQTVTKIGRLPITCLQEMQRSIELTPSSFQAPPGSSAMWNKLLAKHVLTYPPTRMQIEKCLDTAYLTTNTPAVQGYEVEFFAAAFRKIQFNWILAPQEQPLATRQMTDQQTITEKRLFPVPKTNLQEEMLQDGFSHLPRRELMNRPSQELVETKIPLSPQHWPFTRKDYYQNGLVQIGFHHKWAYPMLNNEDMRAPCAKPVAWFEHDSIREHMAFCLRPSIQRMFPADMNRFVEATQLEPTSLTASVEFALEFVLNGLDNCLRRYVEEANLLSFTTLLQTIHKQDHAKNYETMNNAAGTESLARRFVGASVRFHCADGVPKEEVKEYDPPVDFPLGKLVICFIAETNFPTRLVCRPEPTRMTDEAGQQHLMELISAYLSTLPATMISDGSMDFSSKTSAEIQTQDQQKNDLAMYIIRRFRGIMTRIAQEAYYCYGKYGMESLLEETKTEMTTEMKKVDSGPYLARLYTCH